MFCESPGRQLVKELAMINNGLPVLLLYPTFYRVTGVPVGLATLAAVLREAGCEVRVFDTAFYRSLSLESQNDFRTKVGMSKKVINADLQYDNSTDLEEDLLRTVAEFSPKVIGITFLEPTYHIGLYLIRTIKNKYPDIPVIAGGVFSTLSPEFVLAEDAVDAVCVGEGETSIVELCRRISEGKDINDVEGLWLKKDGNIHRNKLSTLHSVDKIPLPDYSVFDERLFYKPMQGRLYKMINIESTRGCPFQCTYCAAPLLHQTFHQRNCGTYFRSMAMEKVIEQIHHQVEKHDPEFIYFSSETFLSMSDEDLALFVEAYDQVRIPFWFQTRLETITEERIRKLKEVGMSWLTIGLEHGNEEFRKKVLKRKYSNNKAVECIKILARLEIGASVNNIMGFPCETRELIFDTIMLNRELWWINPRIECNVFMFTPYQGCELYDTCVEQGLVPRESFLNACVASDESVLAFPREWKLELAGLYRTFNLYIKLPEEYYDRITLAEQPDEKGKDVFRKLLELPYR